MKTNLGDNFEYHLVKGTHLFHLNNPELVAPIVANFLDVKLNSKKE